MSNPKTGISHFFTLSATRTVPELEFCRTVPLTYSCLGQTFRLRLRLRLFALGLGSENPKSYLEVVVVSKFTHETKQSDLWAPSASEVRLSGGSGEVRERYKDPRFHSPTPPNVNVCEQIADTSSSYVRFTNFVLCGQAQIVGNGTKIQYYILSHGNGMAEARGGGAQE